MAGERQWVRTLAEAINEEMTKENLVVKTGFNLPYTLHVDSYQSDAELSTAMPNTAPPHVYQTDLLLAERAEDLRSWVPRVVVEFKLGRVTTHDALTYSTKAATHKNVHPYLRYGLIIGGYRGPVPRRVIRHGQNFDFMATLVSEVLTAEDQTRLISILKSEVDASRTLGDLLSERSNKWLLHRKLVTAE